MDVRRICSSALVMGMLAGSVATAMASDLTFSVVNEQTYGTSYSADLLVQHGSGVTELIPFFATATGQYTIQIESGGSPYTPSGSLGAVFGGPGAGAGNGGPGGGGGPPQVILGAPSNAPIWASDSHDEQIQHPIVWGILATCVTGRAMAAAIAEFHCRHAAGVGPVEYGFCGYPMKSADCREDPPPPEPLPPPSGPGGGGGSPGGGGNGGGLSFVNFGFETVTGIVTVGEIQ